MTLFRDYLGPALIVLTAGLMIGLAAWPVGSTQWAEGFREKTPAQANGAEPNATAEQRKPNGTALLVLPTVKVVVIMGIGVMFTAAGLALVRRRKRKRKTKRATENQEDQDAQD